MNARHEITLVRHELKRRTLTVSRVEAITPLMRRIHFASDDLADFESLSPDDHVKLFFPSADGPVMRDYTPRAYSDQQRTLTIDFALHDAGHATQWAVNAQLGQTLQIGGPRGSKVVPDDFDWYLLVGDESGLPAIGRRVEELREGVPVITVVCIARAAEQQQFSTRAAWKPVWIERGTDSERDAERVLAALTDFVAPPGDGFVRVAGEASLAKAVRTYFIEQREHPRAWVRASGYWQRGKSDAHAELDE
ncbi:MAG TPA: siderophore-interacting protein [Polyangiales bacterium]|nr:siderophore-interacting protein [Polyangiales bacterium]